MSLANPTEAAWRVQYAYEYTQRLYDEYPPDANVAPPLLGAIYAWPFVCSCYMGIEQALKFMIRLRNEVPEKKLKKTHDLEWLYSWLCCSERDVVATYYRIYRSLYNFDTGDISIDTAQEFIQHIGQGYAAWRYILAEDHTDIPKMHLGLMFEIWRSLADLARLKQLQIQEAYAWRPLNKRVDIYFRTEVIDKAERDEVWQVAAQDDTSGVNFGDIRDWVKQKGGYLKAGICLFRDQAMNTRDSYPDSSVLRKVLRRRSWSNTVS